jgi:hypothetical protein
MQVATTSRWNYDSVFFEATVRRSGNSLVITVPPELVRRFLISEGQKVRLEGAIRNGLRVEGAISIYLGRFVVKERATGIKFVIEGQKVLDESIPKFLSDVANRYYISDIEVKLKKKGIAQAKLLLTSITMNGIVPRSTREVRMVIEEIKVFGERAGYKIREVEMFEQEVNWENIDPALLSKSAEILDSNITYKWVM